MNEASQKLTQNTYRKHQVHRIRLLRPQVSQRADSHVLDKPRNFFEGFAVLFTHLIFGCIAQSNHRAKPFICGDI